MRILVIVSFLFVLLNASPLQDATDQSANLVSNILGAFQGTKSLNLTQFLQSFDMPTCMRRCLPQIGNIGSLFQKTKDQKALKALCDNMKESTECAAMSGCTHVFMDALSESFQFMCIENLDKISDHFACIEESSGYLQQDCENECAVQADMIDKASKNKADQLFSVENMCNSTTCLVDCYRSNIEKRCNIGENNIIDVILSQVAKGEKNGYEQIMGWVLPEGCKDSEGLNIKIPKKIPLDSGKPKNVGKPVASLPAVTQVPTVVNDAKRILDFPEEDLNSTAVVETALLVDGKVQTLQCQMLDWERNPMQTPDFDSIAKIITTKFPQYSIQKVDKTPPKATCLDDDEKPSKKIKKSLPDGLEHVSKSSKPRALMIIAYGLKMFFILCASAFLV